MKHTAGPWRIATDHNGTPRHVVADSYTTVCSFLTSVKRSCGSELIDANARLIAAAPALLDALQSVNLWMENQADGQSKGGHATFDLMMLREQRDITRAAIAKATGVSDA